MKWLEEHRRINADRMKAVKFLTAYRNAFHEFGRHSGRDLESKGCWLRDGDRLPTLDQTSRIEMLEDLLDVFLEVNADRQ